MISHCYWSDSFPDGHWGSSAFCCYKQHFCGLLYVCLGTDVSLKQQPANAFCTSPSAASFGAVGLYASQSCWCACERLQRGRWPASSEPVTLLWAGHPTSVLASPPLSRSPSSVPVTPPSSVPVTPPLCWSPLLCLSRWFCLSLLFF